MIIFKMYTRCCAASVERAHIHIGFYLLSVLNICILHTEGIWKRWSVEAGGGANVQHTILFKQCPLFGSDQTLVVFVQTKMQYFRCRNMSAGIGMGNVHFSRINVELHHCNARIVRKNKIIDIDGNYVNKPEGRLGLGQEYITDMNETE